MNIKPLSGRRAFVTGGGSGIGKAIAAALADAGVRVTICGRDEARLAHTAKNLDVAYAVMDVTKQSEVDQVCAEAGAVDILVNNAGNAASAPFGKTDRALWDGMLALNLTGTYSCIHALLPGMLERDYGRVVNVASLAGLMGYAYVSAYCAAKHGVIGLTRALALETARSNVTVNAVCPGYTDTELVVKSVQNIREKSGRNDAEIRELLVSNNPQRRLVRPEEVANAVLWLCQPGSEAITGQSIAVAGGEWT